MCSRLCCENCASPPPREARVRVRAEVVVSLLSTELCARSLSRDMPVETEQREHSAAAPARSRPLDGDWIGRASFPSSDTTQQVRARDQLIRLDLMVGEKKAISRGFFR